HPVSGTPRAHCLAERHAYFGVDARVRLAALEAVQAERIAERLEEVRLNTAKSDVAPVRAFVRFVPGRPTVEEVLPRPDLLAVREVPDERSGEQRQHAVAH